MPVLRNGLGAGALALLAFGCAPGEGPGTDWSLKGRVGYSANVDVNRALEPGESDVLLSNALNAGLVLDAETKRALFSADLGIAARYAVGEDDTEAGTGRVDPTLALRASVRSDDTTLSADGGLSVQSTDVTQADDTGVTDQDVTQFNANAGVSVSHNLDSRNSVTAGVNANLTEFSEDVAELTPNRTLGASLGWQRELSETTTANLSAGMRHFESDGEAGTRSQTLDISAGLNHRRTSRHTFRVTLGSTAVRTIEKAASGDPVLTLGLTGGAGFDYTLKRLRAGLNLNQSVDPSATGALQSFTRVNGSLSYDLSEASTLGMTLAFARRTPLSGDGDTLETFSLGPVYSLRLDPETRLSLSYLFRLQRSKEDGLVNGHRVFLSVNRDFAILD